MNYNISYMATQQFGQEHQNYNYTEHDVFEMSESGETEHYIVWVKWLTETLDCVERTEGFLVISTQFIS